MLSGGVIGHQFFYNSDRLLGGVENVKGGKNMSGVTKAWIQKALREIEMLKPVESDNPGDHGIRYSLPVDIQFDENETGNDFSIWKERVKKQTFQERLLECIAQSGMKNQEFYKAAYIDRKLFSAIKTNPNYHPQKETAVACCFALRLSLSDAKELLELAGYSLSLSIAWDRVIYYCMKKKIFDIDIVNELLYEEGEKCIRV